MSIFSTPRPLTLKDALKKEEMNLEALRQEVAYGSHLYNRVETVELNESLATSEATVAAYKAELEARAEAWTREETRRWLNGLPSQTEE